MHNLKFTAKVINQFNETTAPVLLNLTISHLHTIKTHSIFELDNSDKVHSPYCFQGEVNLFTAIRKSD